MGSVDAQERHGREAAQASLLPDAATLGAGNMSTWMPFGDILLDMLKHEPRCPVSTAVSTGRRGPGIHTALGSTAARSCLCNTLGFVFGFEPRFQKRRGPCLPLCTRTRHFTQRGCKRGCPCGECIGQAMVEWSPPAPTPKRWAPALSPGAWDRGLIWKLRLCRRDDVKGLRGGHRGSGGPKPRDRGPYKRQIEEETQTQRRSHMEMPGSSVRRS